ncbi:MAG: hypothetical protein GY737_00165 [Desulfobacteraceae bacterium]|nr:hypothetical protein [Desulfobacteraceae bacterium]
MSKIEVRWEVEDGYVGKSRPQSCEIDSEDISLDGDKEDMMDQVYDEVNDDFANKISFYVANFDEVYEALLEAKKGEK